MEKMVKKINAELANPPSEYRAAPFWAWNGKLEPDELRRQISYFKKMGLGGFFMHSRVGLDTKYLGNDWFNCIKASIDEAKKDGLLAYLYDEDRWPSGAAGGFVTKEEKYRQIRLVLYIYDKKRDFKVHSNQLGLFIGKINGYTLDKVRKADDKFKLLSGESLIEICWEHEAPTSWYNGQSYIDVLNPEAVARFIEVTHEAYLREIGPDFGKTVPAIFTDEPNFARYLGNIESIRGAEKPAAAAPWTTKFAETFKQLFDYDILDRIYEVFFNLPGQKFSTLRYHFFMTTTKLFVESYSKQIGEWCGKNHIAFTGHMLCEDTLALQTASVGSAMRHYEYMQMPGIDQLCEYEQIYVTCKQLSSMAHQFEKPRRLSETYGCTGWDFPLAGHKALGDWQYAEGVNLRCPHLAWYTASGEAKRDYPASISYQSNYGPYYHVVEDYFARLGLLMVGGNEVRDLLMVHPIESAWGRVLPIQYSGLSANVKSIRKLDTDFDYLVVNTLARNLDFDFGEEDVMARHAKVESVNGRTALIIGKGVYYAVLVPRMNTIRRTTLELLKKFASNGGKIAVETHSGLPDFVDGIADNSARKFFEKLPSGIESIDHFCRRVTLRGASGRPAKVVLTNLHESADTLTLMLCNTSYARPVGVNGEPVRVVDRRRSYRRLEVEVTTGRDGVWFEMEPETGKVYQVDSEKTANGYLFVTSLEALRTRIFVLAAAGSFQTVERDAPRPRRAVNSEKLVWTTRCDEDNVLVLDHPAWTLDGGKEHKKSVIFKVDADIRNSLGEWRRGGAMMQPWAAAKTEHAKGKVVLRYEFKSTLELTGKCAIAVEEPDTMSFKLNGAVIKPRDIGFFVDICCRKLEFDANLIKVGRNELEISVNYDCFRRGLENIYLLGAFGVRADGVTLTAAPKTVKFGNWVTQGLPNYAGNLSYETRINYSGSGLCRMVAGDYRGAALRVLVNGTEVKIMGWEPYEAELSAFLKPGENRITVEVIGSRRNSHGPFYCGTNWMRWTGPAQFREYVSSKRMLVPSGLMKAPKFYM